MLKVYYCDEDLWLVFFEVNEMLMLKNENVIVVFGLLLYLLILYVLLFVLSFGCIFIG